MANRKSALTQQRLKSVLHYDPDTGLFVWLGPKPQKRHMLGCVAGSVGYQGYISIRVDGTPQQAHRLAFLYVTGEWPTGDVDHLNGRRADNRWENLRECSRSENMQNVSLQRNNTSGHTGVTWNKGRRKWVAQICHGRTYKNLGGFTDFKVDKDAYLKAKAELHTFQPTPRAPC